MISLGCHHGSKKKQTKKNLKKCCAHSRRILSTCHLKRHRTACDRLTREASGGCLAARQPWHLILLWHHIRGRERIKASVAFTGGETSKDDFAWWDNLVTTGVYVVLKCVCDTAALKIGSECERELLLLPLSVTFFTPSRPFCPAQQPWFPSLLLRKGAEVCLEQLGVTSCLIFSLEPGSSFMQISSAESSLRFLWWTLFVPRWTRVSQCPTSSCHFLKSKLIILPTVLSMLQLIAFNWLHWPAQVETSPLKRHLLF